MKGFSPFQGAWRAGIRALACLLLLAPPQPTLAEGDVPVTVSLAVSPAAAAEDEVIELTLKLVVTGAWHVYGDSPGAGGQQPMKLKLKLPEGIEPVGEWVWPANAYMFTAGEHVFTHRLKLAGLQGKATVEVSVMYQACDPQMCLPPDIVQLEAEVDGAAGKSSVSSRQAADEAFKAIEQQLKPLYDGFDDIVPGYKNLGYPEQLRMMDRQRRKIFAAGEVFVRHYPADERVFDVLRMCFPMFFPFFFDQNQALSPDLTALWESRETAKTDEEKDGKYAELLRRMPKDPAAEADWLRRGDVMVATITAVPGITRENRERAQFLLLARWIMTSGHKRRYQAVDWSAFYPLFAAHARTYTDMEKMGARANDVLGAMRRSSPEAAEAGWKYLLANAVGDGSSPGAKAIQESAAAQLESIAIAASGRKFEALKFAALDGRTVDLGALRGKVVLIDFWATWCKPCVAQMPVLKKLYERHRAQGLEIIGISGDDGTAEQLAAFLKAGGYEWPQHYDGKGTGNYFAQMFAVKAWPTTYLIGRDGAVAGTNLWGAALESAIQNSLNVR